MTQLDLFTPERGSTGIVHILTPDFATLCREDYLEASARGDRCSISPHHDDRDRVEVPLPRGIGKGLRWVRIRWRNITCQWCRSLGHEYYRHCLRLMQNRQA